MADSTVQQIKERLDIVEVVSGYLKLEKTGINLRACCPFHGEKKPSFFVSPARQTFRCFGCGESGDIFSFVMKIEGIEFIEALRLLAKRAGVEMKSFSPQAQSKKQRLYQICQTACLFFEKQLESPKGKRVEEYLLGRGLKLATIKQFRLGFAPSPSTASWRVLSDFLVGQGFEREEIVEAGLAVKPEKGQTPYDRFRGRIIFPVFDLQSQVVGFGGRAFEEDDSSAKYLNTPNTPLYDKGKILYGLNFAKMALRQNDACILTEGYMDVILSQQAGCLNTVASSGTALTPDQLKILKRYTNNLITAFDMDKAGDMATKRGIDLALEQEFEIKVIEMPQGQDPADVASKDSAKWQELVNSAQSVMDYYFSSAMAKNDSQSPLGKKEIAQAILPKIKQIPNRILQAHWLSKLAGLINTAEEAVWQELKRLGPEQSGQGQSQNAHQLEKPARISQKTQSRAELLEENILSLVLKQPACLNEVPEAILANCQSPVGDTLRFLKKKKYGEISLPEPKILVDFAKDKGDDFKFLIEKCFFKAEEELTEDPIQEIKLCSNCWLKILQQNQLKDLSGQINQAETTNDQAKLQSLMEQFNKLSQENHSGVS